MNIEYDADWIVVVMIEKVIMECKPEYSKLADILDKREKKEKGKEEKQPWGLLYWLQCKQMLIIHELTMHMHFAY